MKYFDIWTCLGFGALLFALPKLMVGAYKPMKVYQMGFDVCAVNKSTSYSLCTEKSSSSNFIYLIAFVIAQLIMGAGTTPFYTLGK